MHVIVVIKSTGELNWSVAEKDLICDLMDIYNNAQDRVNWGELLIYM